MNTSSQSGNNSLKTSKNSSHKAIFTYPELSLVPKKIPRMPHYHSVAQINQTYNYNENLRVSGRALEKESTDNNNERDTFSP